jgi:cytochrome c553
MRYTTLIILVFLFAVNDSRAQKKVEFDYPADSVAESSKKAFVKNFSQGKILYATVCSRCHNVKEDRKEIIPDFSLPQLMDYEMRFTYPEHMDRLTDTHITDEEMNKIILFLRFKKKSGKPIHG